MGGIWTRGHGAACVLSGAFGPRQLLGRKRPRLDTIGHREVPPTHAAAHLPTPHPPHPSPQHPAHSHSPQGFCPVFYPHLFWAACRADRDRRECEILCYTAWLE